MDAPTNFPPPTRLEHVPVMPEPGTRFRRDGKIFILEGYDISCSGPYGPRRLTLHLVELPEAIAPSNTN